MTDRDAVSTASQRRGRASGRPTSTGARSPWVTIVWNDPVNLMSYVTYVFQELFGYAKEKAEKLMLDVHHKGRAVVSSGTREEMERDAADPARLRPVGHRSAGFMSGRRTRCGSSRDGRRPSLPRGRRRVVGEK